MNSDINPTANIKSLPSGAQHIERMNVNIAVINDSNAYKVVITNT